MTDKEKIKKEIERRYSEYKALEDRGNLQDKHAMYEDLCILQFIDSLPEEPKKQPKFRVGDTIKGPCNNVFQVKEVLDTQYLLHSENGDELNSIEIVDKYSCISEEPASEDLEEAANQHSKQVFHGLLVEDNITAFKAGAEWQRNQIKEVLQTKYEKGRFDMREEMMKVLIGGEVVKDIHNQLSVESEPLNDTFRDVKFGDKVKIVIIQED